MKRGRGSLSFFPTPMIQRPYEHLIVWQEAHTLCRNVHDLLKQFPGEERHELSSQIHQAAYSVPMNIVEANMKRTKKAKLNFLNHSEASLEELDYQLLLSRDFQYISQEQFERIRNQVGKVSYLLNRFRSGIESKK